MKTSCKYLYFIICLIFQTSLVVQAQIKIIKQIDYPKIKGFSNPLTMGIGQPCIALSDANFDNKLDLFVLNYNSELGLYLNKGDWKFEYVLDSGSHISTQSRFILSDLNADNLPDFITSNNFSQILVYKNIGSNNFLFENKPSDTLRDSDGNFLYLVGDMVPALADIDNDEDLDLFLGNVDGSVTFIENIGNKYNYKFKNTDKRLGDILVTSGKNIENNDEENLTIYKLNDKQNQKPQALHGGSTLTFNDIDNDGDLDLFFGDLNLNTILMFRNSGSKTKPVFGNSNHDTVFKANGGVVSTEGYNQIVFGDIDNDGDDDALVSQFRSSLNDRKIMTLENVGSNSNPFYTEKNIDITNDFDIGAYSAFSLLRDMNGNRIFAVNGNGNVQIIRFTYQNESIVLDSFQIIETPGSLLYIPSVAQNIHDSLTNSEIVIGTQEGDLRLMRLTSNNKLFRLPWVLDSVKFGQPISPTFCNCGENFEYGILCGLSNGKFVFYKKIGNNNYIKAEPAKPFDTLDIGYDASVCSSTNLTTKFGFGYNELISVCGKSEGGNYYLKLYKKESSRYVQLKTDEEIRVPPFARTMFINNDNLLHPLQLLVGNLSGGMESYKLILEDMSISNDEEHDFSPKVRIKAITRGSNCEIKLEEIMSEYNPKFISSQVYSTIGKNIHIEENQIGSKIILTTKGLNSGVYFVSLTTLKKNYIIKLLIF